MHCVIFGLFFSICVWDYAATYRHDPWVSKNTLSIGGKSIPLFHFGDKSYYVGESKLRYFEADQFCKSINMNLVAVHSSEEFEALWNYVRKTTSERKLWTSGSILLDGSNFIWMSTLEPVTFAKWKPGEPNNKYLEKCLEFLSDDDEEFLFNDRDCDAKVAFICERYNNRQVHGGQQIHAEFIRQYPESSVVDGIKYQVSKFAATQNEASKECKKYGMELITILDKRKNDIVTDLIRKHLNPDIENFFWTSAKKLTNGSWTWLKDEPMVYTNWATPEPNKLYETKLCMHLFADGKWSDLNCEDKLLFICEGPNIESLQSCSSPTINVYINNDQNTHGTNTQSTCSCNNGKDEADNEIFSIEPRIADNLNH